MIYLNKFYSFSKPEYRQKLKLILIGTIRDNQDREYVKQLQKLRDNLNINKEVEFKLNISFKELKTQLNQAIIGLHTMKNEQFGISLSNIRYTCSFN
jgi:alpha-1,2-mannosyltransferase